MRIFKTHPLFKLANSYLIDSPQPSNISYLWNFGSLLGLCLIIQILTGVTLAMHYNSSVLEAFNSVEHIMRDVNNGWLIRYLHSNTASAFFFLVYLHIGRGIYYGSYRAPRSLVWTIGTVIFLLMVVTAFLGCLYSPKWYELIFNLFLFLSLFSFIIWVSSEKYANIYSYINIYINNILPAHNYKINIYSKYKGLRIQQLNQKRYNTILCNDKKKLLLLNFLGKNELIPVFTYNNLDLDETRKLILKDTKNLSGIYLIFNNINGDYYIGSASTNRFYSRFSNHLLYFRGSKILKHAVKKYNLSNFTYLILELFPEKVNKENNKKLLNLEDFYLKSLLPNYNILTEAGSSFGYKHTELDRIKLKTNYSLERREFIRNLNKGKKLLEETVEKIREKALNRGKINYSEKALANFKKKSKPVIVYNLNDTVFGQYPSITEAANNLNCSSKTIIRALKTDKKILKRRFIVKYLI